MMIAEVGAGLDPRAQGEMHMPGMFGVEDDIGNGAVDGAGEVPAHDVQPERADPEEVTSDEEEDDEDLDTVSLVFWFWWQHLLISRSSLCNRCQSGSYATF